MTQWHEAILPVTAAPQLWGVWALWSLRKAISTTGITAGPHKSVSTLQTHLRVTCSEGAKSVYTPFTLTTCTVSQQPGQPALEFICSGCAELPRDWHLQPSTASKWILPPVKVSKVKRVNTSTKIHLPSHRSGINQQTRQIIEFITINFTLWRVCARVRPRDKAPAFFSYIGAKGKGGNPSRGKPPVRLAAMPTSPRTAVVNENKVVSPLLMQDPSLLSRSWTIWAWILLVLKDRKGQLTAMWIITYPQTWFTAFLFFLLN